MGLDMLGMMMRGAGIDPDALMGQAKSLADAFEKMAAQQGEILARLGALQASVDAISTAMGIYVPPPSDAMIAIIDLETKRFLAAPERGIAQ